MEDCKMNNLSDMIWIELRKAIRSRMPLWTALGSLFMPLGIAFLIFVSKNPEISQKLGLISAKANLVAYSVTDWPTYLRLFGQIIAAGGFFLFVLAISWVFGREFADGTLKDMLAVPVQRSSIILAKFIVTAIWSAALTIVMFIVGLVMGAIIKLPGGSISVILQGSTLLLVTACLVIALVMPFALFASVGRGYLL
jgi:ABC-2 type transport system permease protein